MLLHKSSAIVLGWRRIVQLSSLVEVQPLAAQPDYGGAKAAVIDRTVSLGEELANSGITVNTVTPRPIMTAGWVEWARRILSARGWCDDLLRIEHRVVRALFPKSVGRPRSR